MLINLVLCILSVAETVALYALCPTLSLWWLAALLVGGYIVSFLLVVLATVIFSCLVRRAKPTGARRVFYLLVSHLAEWACLLCGMRVYTQGADRLPTDRPFLAVGNHLSNLDPLVALAALRGHEVAFVSKPENFKIPVVGLVMRNAAFLPIDRENPRNAVTAIKQAAQSITERRLNMGIYPEGTRNKTGEGLLEFHNGSFKIATTAKCPVAVLALRYEKGTFPHRRHACIEVAEIIDADYVAANRTDAISERTRAIIQQTLTK